jgi:hypothetical protein
MSLNLAPKKISDLFFIKSGDFHATKELDPGTIPLISCGDIDNGLVGYFDIPTDKRYQHMITVAYNGQPLLAKFHPYEFGAKDDVAVLRPQKPMLDSTLLYIAAELNLGKWRYSYGRKCFREKLENVQIQVPVRRINGSTVIDEKAIADYFSVTFTDIKPYKHKPESVTPPVLNWREFTISELFTVKRGDFHSLASLDPGAHRTVSRITQDNGTVGYFDRPEKAKVYPSGSITVSTVGGDAFFQINDYIATDNILILTPTHQVNPETLVFIAFALNREKWRYSYGRQCYKTKFEAITKVWLPVDKDGNLDEPKIKAFVENTAYWQRIKPELSLT